MQCLEGYSFPKSLPLPLCGPCWVDSWSPRPLLQRQALLRSRRATHQLSNQRKLCGNLNTIICTEKVKRAKVR